MNNIFANSTRCTKNIQGCHIELLLILLVLSLCYPVHAQRYVKVTGEINLISYRAIDPNGRQYDKHRNYNLTCIVGTNEWRIDNEFSPYSKEAWYFDGTNLYWSMQRTKDASSLIPKIKGMPAQVPFEKARSNVTVRILPSSGHPLGDTGDNMHPIGNLGVNIPWLAFCSGSYLKKAGRAVPLPTVTIQESVNAFDYTDKTITFEDSLGLPEACKLYSPGANHALAFDYAVDEYTNFEGWTFPIKFHYVAYRSDGLGVWTNFVGGIGHLTSIQEVAKPENVLLLDSHTTVVDYRFYSTAKSVNGIIYGATNLVSGMATNNPLLQARYAALLQKRPHRPFMSTSQIRLLVISIMCFPVLLLAWNLIPKKQKLVRKNE